MTAIAPGWDTRALSVADAIARLPSWADLPVARRRNAAADLRLAARIAAVPADCLMLDPVELRAKLLRLSAGAMGVPHSRASAVRSSLNLVMRRLDLIDAENSMPWSVSWASALGSLPAKKQAGLIRLARFANRRGIEPEGVTEGTLEDFVGYLTYRTNTAQPAKVVAYARTALNTLRAASARLARPRKARQFILPLSAFPPNFAQDLARFAEGMAGGPASIAAILDPAEPPILRLSACRTGNPARPISVESRAAHCRWAASALVADGYPIEQITSLGALVQPLENSAKILTFVFQNAGRKRYAQGMHVANALRIVARHHVGMREEDVGKIVAMGGQVAIRYQGITEKNTRTLRAVMSGKRLADLDALPNALFKAAETLIERAPTQAWGLAWRGLGLALLLARAFRLKNIIGLRLDQHLQRPDPRRSAISRIVLPADEMKTGRELTSPVSPALAELLHRWITRFRPLLAPPGNPYLFPSPTSGKSSLSRQAFRGAIKACTAEHLDVVISPHQFRHLAATRYLQRFPGEFDTVGTFLGHASGKTSKKFNTGPRREATVSRFDEYILGGPGSAAKRNESAGRRPGSKRGGA